jgi:hypothetical protein
VYQNLTEALGSHHDFLAPLRESFLGHSLRAFQTAPEFVDLADALAHAGVRALALKGLALSQQLYGNLVSRPVGDLDLLIPTDQAWNAAQVLESRGYVQSSPARLSDSQEKALIRYLDGRQFFRPRTGVDADLNWRTLDRWVDVRLPFEQLWERRELLDFPTGSLATLSREDTALILCLHGCQHGFERIKWVVDVAQAAELEPKVRWTEVRDRAGHRKPMVDYALLVAHELLGSRLPDECDPVPAVAALAQRTAAHLYARDVPPGEAGMLDRAILTNLQPCLSTRGILGLLSNLRTFSYPSKEDITSVSFPVPLHGLYYVVRLLHLAKKLMRRGKKEPIA